MGMLDSLKEAAANAALTLAQRMAPPDLAVFGDPVAVQTKWTSLAKSSSNFRAYSLEALDDRRLAFKPTLVRHILWSSLILGGLGIGFGGWPNLVSVGLGAAIAAVGGAFLFRPKRQVFDGHQAQCEGVGTQPTLAFNSIRAVQLISRYVSGKNGGYEVNELNLVLNDASRIHVHSDPSLPRARETAGRLSALIGCRFWDATAVPKVKFDSLEEVKKFGEGR